MNAKGTFIVSSITGIGSTILATPMLKALRRARPDDRIVLLVRFAATRDLLAAGRIADEILVCDYKTLPSMSARLDFLHSLRRLDASVFINTFPGNRRDKHLLARFSGASVRIGHRYTFGQRRNFGFLVNRHVPIQSGTHDVEQNLALLEPLGIQVAAGDELPQIWVSESEDTEAASALRKLGEGPFIGIHPGSSIEQGMLYKRWHPSNFAAVGRELARRMDARILVFGGPEESGIKQRVADEIGTAALAVSGSIGRTAALIRRTRGFVSSDSGLMHVAAATGVPTVAVFGPTDPHRTAPRGSYAGLVRAGLDCSPCWRLESLGKPFHCIRGRPECMEAVDIDQVLDSLISLIDSREAQMRPATSE